MNKKQLYLKLFVLIFFFSISKIIQSQNLKLSSPDKLIEVKIQTLNQLKFQVSLKNKVIIENVAIGIEMICYRMRAYGIRSSSFGGHIGFDKNNYPNIGFRFVTPSFTHITKYVYDECMKELAELIESFCHRKIAVRSLTISTQNMDKNSQMNLFFQLQMNPLN